MNTPRTALALLALAALACSLAGPTAAQPTAQVPPTEAPVTAPPPTPSVQAATPLPPIPSERPLVWFAPLPPMPFSEARRYNGSEDFWQLFEPDAPWTEAAGHIQVFKVYGDWLAYYYDQAEFEQLVAGLNQRGIALGLEVGGLDPSTECEPIEGFAPRSLTQDFISRIQDAGGVLRFLVFDAPYAAGHIYDGPNPCHWEADRIAQEVDTYVQIMRGAFPDLIVADIEPLWAGVEPADYEHWLEAFRQTTGYDFAMLDMDNDFSRPDWAQANLELEQFSRAHGIEFGITYFGNGDDTSDEQWLGHAEARMIEYETRLGGRPDHVILQSWHDHPDFVLPETQPNTYTWFVNRYFRARTALTVELQQPGDGSASLAGALTEADGTPLASAPVALTLIPREGDGVYFEYTLSGSVPEGASTADVGYRVNDECDCSGASDFALYSVRYQEGEETTNRIPNGDFGQGLDGWGMWGEGQAQLQPSDHGPGRMLHVAADPGQAASANSNLFSVTSGAAFTVTFAVRISPRSAGSGYFGLIFLNGDQEVTRVQIPLAPAAVSLGTATTGDDGSFQLALDQPPGAGNSLEAAFAGDDQYWLAFAEATTP